MKQRWGIALGLAATLGACDESQPGQPAEPGIGVVTVAVGSDVREVPFGKADCRDAGDVTVVELFSTDTLPQGRPRVLLVRMRTDEVLEAHAFVPRVSFDGVDYDMLQLVAKEVPGAKKPDCRVEREENTMLICNDTTIVGWLGAGPRPNPSFKVSFACE